jgi:hypothetical protein
VHDDDDGRIELTPGVRRDAQPSPTMMYCGSGISVMSPNAGDGVGSFGTGAFGVGDSRRRGHGSPLGDAMRTYRVASDNPRRTEVFL